MDHLPPLVYRWLRAHGLQPVAPWHFSDDPAFIETRRTEYRREAGDDHDLRPFAYRQDNDTIAGFIITGGQITEQVLTVHLTWKGSRELPGWPATTEPMPFTGWLQACMLADSLDGMSEAALAAVMADR